ncbi:MAG: helix-turn-helix domain-containing protein [Kiritimatiellae bacterium]|nr:helix-turn-helix domain-containing protein [Kiritimatiellia bacterium]
MNATTYKAIEAILKVDQTLSALGIASILAVCRESRPERKSQNNVHSPQLVTPRQAAEILQTSVRTVWRLTAEGKLRRVKLGYRSTRFPAQDIEKLISETPG